MGMAEPTKRSKHEFETARARAQRTARFVVEALKAPERRWGEPDKTHMAWFMARGG